MSYWQLPQGLRNELPEFKKNVLEVLRQVNEELGTSTAVITHNAEIRRMAHRVIWFQDGCINRVETNEHRIAPAEIVW